jgi:large subunit ribosomal protein L9
MEVILLEKVQHLGDLGDRVKIRPGYGRNYLIPKGLAVVATPENLAEFESHREDFRQAAIESKDNAEARREALEQLSVTISCKAGMEGKLFGSVGSSDIAEAVTEAGVPVTKSEIRLSEGTLRQLGEYQVGIHLHSDVDAQVKVCVIAEE